VVAALEEADIVAAAVAADTDNQTLNNHNL
jgi:hypothetical protein